MPKIHIAPKKYPVTDRGKKLATIELYHSFDFPVILPRDKENNYTWWDIAESYNRSIEKKDWTTYSESTKEKLNLYILNKMFPAWSDELHRKQISFPNEKELVAECKKILKKCADHIFEREIIIRLFPRRVPSWYHPANGYTQAGGLENYKQTIHIFIDGSYRWKRSLRETLAHEYIHVVYDRRVGTDTSLASWMILEGMALHFSNYLYPTENKLLKNRFISKPISYAEAKKLLKKNKYWLHRKLSPAIKEQLYHEEDTIYAVGYKLFGLFADTLPGLDWDALTYNYPEEIVKVSMWALDEKLKKKNGKKKK